MRLAVNDPRIIGIAVRCKRCRWSFRCPAAQPDRVMCRACEERVQSEKQKETLRANEEPAGE